MPRPSRLALASALLAVLAATAARAAEPDKLLPAKTDILIAVELKKALAADVAKNLSREELIDELYRTDTEIMAAAMGVDVVKDVERFTLAYVDTSYGDGLDANFLLILRGLFDLEKSFKAVDAAVRKDPDRYAMLKEGQTVVVKYTRGPKSAPVYGTAIDGKTVVIGSDKKLVTDAVKAADADKPAPVKKELADLLRKADDKSVITLVFLLKGKFDATSLANSPLTIGGIRIGGPKSVLKYDKLDKVLPKTEHAVVTVVPGEAAEFVLTVTMRDEAAANDMRDAAVEILDQLKPLAGLAALTDPHFKALPALVAAIKVTTKNSDVTIALRAGADTLGAMLPAPKKKTPPKKN